MKRTHGIALAVSGILLGTAMIGPAARAAELYAAQRSTQNIFVNGEQMQMEAYTINGETYVKLRDVGKALDINIYWDGAVRIDSSTPYTGVTPVAEERSVPLKNVPEVGDRIVCDDGSTYEIKDMYRWNSEASKPGNLPGLPEPTCDWSKFPILELPAVRKIHYKSDKGDNLFMLNLYETRRMEYTLYNALGNEPGAWKDGEPLATVQFGIPAEKEQSAGVFWPWRESQLTDLVHSRPASHYRCEAYDYYHNGIYQHTRYYILSE